MQQTIHGDCTEPSTFVCEHLSVCLDNPFSQEAVCCIHHPHKKHEQDQLFLGPLLYLFSGDGCASIPFLCFSSLADRIKHSETPKYSEQYFCDHEPGAKVNIFNFSVFEMVTNFSFIAACSLSSSSALFLVSLSYIGGDSSISISETYAVEMFPLYTFKTFFNLPFAFEAQLCWVTPWVLTGETPILSRVELSFFLVIHTAKNHHLMLIRLVNSVPIISVIFSFSGGLNNFSYSVTHCLHNF